MTFMEREALESPQAVQRFLETNKSALTELGRRLREMEPPFILTSARGSSDNAAGYLKYLSEILLGTPCASIGASVASLYGSRLKARNALAVTISQSGKSPDIIALQDEAKRAGALSLALVNVQDSPAGKKADICLPLCAGPERSVAATKSLVVSLAAAAALVAHWLNDQELIGAVAGLPDSLAAASKISWPGFIEALADVDSLYVLGRGPSLPIAAETALKLKETCALHAEAYSAAEVMHGPLELIGDGFPVFVYAQEDQSLPSTQIAIQRLKGAGAKLLVAGAGGMPIAPARHRLLEPIVMIQTVYLAIEKLARMRGRDPDTPRMLHKVTETV